MDNYGEYSWTYAYLAPTFCYRHIICMSNHRIVLHSRIERSCHHSLLLSFIWSLRLKFLECSTSFKSWFVQQDSFSVWKITVNNFVFSFKHCVWSTQIKSTLNNPIPIFTFHCWKLKNQHKHWMYVGRIFSFSLSYNEILFTISVV